MLNKHLNKVNWQMNNVYINALGKFLPGEPVKNSDIEAYLGNTTGHQSKNKAFVLRQNRIKTRYYALDKNGKSQFSNATMSALAIKDAIAKSEINLKDIEFLSSATTIGDVLLPGLASHIQAELGIGPLEIASIQSVCAGSLMAIKNACLQVKCGECKTAVVSASEFSSRYLKANFYENTNYFREHGEIPMESDFLRYTLSDGAGAFVLENKPNQHGLSLEIKWIDIKSFSHQFDTCMVGGKATETFWGDHANPLIAEKEGALILRQDFHILLKMIPVWIAHYLDVLDRYNLSVNHIDYLCCHYSSNSLKIEAMNLLKKMGGLVPEEKWFSNLSSCGNTGSASIFILLEELFHSGRLQRGQKLLCQVPESGRCMSGLMLLEVV